MPRCRQCPDAPVPFLPAETVLALMRNPDYCVYGFAKSKAERSAEDAEQKFNELSLAEVGGRVDPGGNRVSSGWCQVGVGCVRRSLRRCARRGSAGAEMHSTTSCP